MGTNAHAMKRFRSPIPAEGEDGLFTQSWFPICRSEDVGVEEVKGFGFLDGRVVAYRDSKGVASVLSAYCPHVGADLSAGCVSDNHLECAFHKWQFDQKGICRKIPIGDPIPENARLFVFPSQEKYGLIWAFNGLEPTWDIPDFDVPESELEIRVTYDNPIYPTDPWVICANTPDWQHLAIVHHMKFDQREMFDRIQWTDNSMTYRLEAVMDEGKGMEVDINVGIYGTSMFVTSGMFGDVWQASMVAFGLPKPGYTQGFFVNCVTKGDGSEDSRLKNQMALDFLYQQALSITSEDRPILHSIRYVPGILTPSDKALGRYLDMVRHYPRAHPSAEFIR